MSNGYSVAFYLYKIFRKKITDDIEFKSILNKSLNLFLTVFLLIKNNNSSLILIDNLNFLYYEYLEKIFKVLGEDIKALKIIATNSTHLISNELSRPDCIYLIDEDKIKNIYERSDKASNC